MLGAYILLACVFAPLLLDRDGFFGAWRSGRIIVYIVVSAIAFLLPWLLNLLGAHITEILNNNFWFNLAITISPPWLIFLIFSSADDSWIHGIRVIWLVVWVGLLLITVFTMIPDLGLETPGTGQLSIDPIATFKELWHRVSDAGQNTLRGLLGLPEKARYFINSNLEDSLGYSFSGQVDEYDSEDLGVRFTEIKTIAREFREGQDVVVWADIQGESFTDIIQVNLGCYAEDDEENQYTGVIKANGQATNNIVLKLRQKQSLSCTFENLSAGFYDVHVIGVFNFETWGYIPYYFSPQEYILSIWEQDDDPAYEAGIDKRPIAIYTNGPIELGLASEYDQPIPLDTTDPLSSLPPFGASITNVWMDGEIRNLRRLTLMVPSPFTLRECDNLPQEGSKAAPRPSDETKQFREYVFGNLQDGNFMPESVTCFLGIDGDSVPAMGREAESLLGGFQLVMKTFGAKVEYTYEIHDRIDVEVKKRSDR